MVWTYGGDPVALAVQQMAKRNGAKIVFWLYNFAYTDRAAFALADYIIVPSEFSRQYYREKLGLECRVLPLIVHWEEAEVKGREQGARSGEQAMANRPHPNPLPKGEETDCAHLNPAPARGETRRYITFINPQETKGVYVFARIARELAKRRPDIPLLVTQGRSRGDALKNPALGLAEHIAGELHSQAGRPHHESASRLKPGLQRGTSR